MATLGIPAIGYGLRYEYGIFRQAIVDGAQVELPDTWLRYPNPWELPRPERIYRVHFGGRVEAQPENGRDLYRWVDTECVMAMAYDTPVPGYRNDVVNTLRLWSAKAARELDVQRFSQGDYVAAVREKDATENLTRVLYPNDQVAPGRELRLRQEYFFVSATLQDALHRHLRASATVEDLPERAVFQLNDTHPAVAVAELMRLLVDEHGLGWPEAWAITVRSFAYTNHTVMSEALERWPVWLFERLLPRHIQIIYEINRRFLDEVRARWPGDEARVRRMSLIEEGGEQYVRMAHLAVVGSSSVNGVSTLHGRILRERLFADFAELWPQKFGSQTNGVSPRRWLRAANPELASLITSRIGDGWVRDLPQLERLAPLADEPAFRAAWREAKAACKRRLAAYVEAELGVALDTEAIFDVQVKRIHEYKRQLLALLHVVALHRGILAGDGGRVPRAVIFAGKAAPGYDAAKAIIHLIHDVAAVVNADPATNRTLRVVFIPDYGVSIAERIIPAADLSEQISTAGTEASGTSNMKLGLNGALTIGTLDGANVEIREAVGDDNIFIFGLTDAEVEARRRQGYDPGACLRDDPELAVVLRAIERGDYSPRGGDHARRIVDALRTRDPFLVLADFAAYRACQRQVESAFRDREGWTRRSILNVARMGRFSSEETIAGYARDIWRIDKPLSR
jgi:starch phosphorylase